MTGRMWAFEHFDVVPDIVCFGKKTQVCGIMAGSRVDEVADNVFQVSSRLNSTWGGSLTDMVRCEIILETIHKDNLVDNAERVGSHLLGALCELTARHPDRISNARGRGLMCAFDACDAATRDAIIEGALGNHLLVLPCGERSVRLRPPLTLSEREAGEVASRLADAL